tara:strand:- start:475 stop:621 length:147 start_codon:yes stop_codon:yes gene_type:complete
MITKDPPLAAYSLNIGSSIGSRSVIAPGITTTAGISVGSSIANLVPNS